MDENPIPMDEKPTDEDPLNRNMALPDHRKRRSKKQSNAKVEKTPPNVFEKWKEKGNSFIGKPYDLRAYATNEHMFSSPSERENTLRWLWNMPRANRKIVVRTLGPDFASLIDEAMENS